MCMSRPNIALYWTSVCDFLGEVMGIQIKVSPCLVFFGLIQEEGVHRSSPLSKFIFYVALLARREICRFWKSEGPPSFAECLKSVIYTSQSDMACDPSSQDKIWTMLTDWREKTSGSND